MTMREEPTPAEGAGPAAHTEIELKLTGDPNCAQEGIRKPGAAQEEFWPGTHQP